MPTDDIMTLANDKLQSDWTKHSAVLLFIKMSSIISLASDF